MTAFNLSVESNLVQVSGSSSDAFANPLIIFILKSSCSTPVPCKHDRPGGLIKTLCVLTEGCQTNEIGVLLNS